MSMFKISRAWLVDTTERAAATFFETFLAVFGIGGLTSLVSGHLDRVALTAAASAGAAAVLALLKGALAARAKRTVSPASFAPEQQPDQALEQAPSAPSYDAGGTLPSGVSAVDGPLIEGSSGLMG